MANQRAGHSPNLAVGGGDNDRPCSSMSSPTVHTGLEIKGCCPLSSQGTCYHIASREQRVGKSDRIMHHNSIKFWQHLTFLCIHHHWSGQEESVPRGRQVAMLTLRNPLSKGHLFYLNTLIPSVRYNKAWVTIITLYDDLINPGFYPLEIYLFVFLIVS